MATKSKMQDIRSEIKESVRGRVLFDEPMSSHTSLRIGGTVDIMLFPEDPLSLKRIFAAAERENLPVFIFGGGTNILAADGRIPGIAVSLEEFRTLEFTKETDERTASIYAGSGVPLQHLLNFARQNGCSGLEALTGIPGYVGGAVYMNAGSFGTEIKDVIVSVGVMDSHGDISILERDQIRFEYRRSNLPEGTVILGVNIVLKKTDPVEIKKRMKDFLDRKKATQPLSEISAGCVFKNPEGNAAGQLIESTGFKGMRVGDAEVSRVHANYFINRGRATCRDFIELMQQVKNKVREHSGIELEPEIKIIGRN